MDKSSPAAEADANPAEGLARDFIREQADALLALRNRIDPAFSAAVQLIKTASDQMVVTGIGKSGLIARKAAATLASTGTPAIFMHPVEGVHGDLGAVSPQSVLLALSKSGRTDELVKFASHFKRHAGRVISICEPGPSPLSELADVELRLPPLPEAGPLGLAPTTSTLMTLALCDAIAMALLDARGFKEEDFARNHPDGSLGRRLLLRAADLMHGGEDLPTVEGDATFNTLLIEMTGKHLGMACILGADRHLIGTFTDGDLRRLLTRCDSPNQLTAADAWRQSRRDPDEPAVKCSTVKPEVLAVDCLRLMRESEITSLVVADDANSPCGIIRLQDLVKAGIG